MSTHFSDVQLDALRELANIGSGMASTALSGMLGRPVDISVPVASALPLADAVEAAGDGESEVTAVMLGIVGELTGSVVLIVSPEDAVKLCGFLGVEADSEWGMSALGEIGNIVGTSYINALAAMTGFEIEPTPPSTATDMLAAIVASCLAEQADGSDIALVLDSDLAVEGDDCSISFMLIPRAGGVHELLARLGIEA